MKHISLSPEAAAGRRLPFFLAMEEWVARRMPAGDYFFSWQVDPTVICGRNQEIDKEVDLEWCRAHGVDVVRRRSGGGAVFADRENFMFSFITDSDHVADVFRRYTDLIAGALRGLGFEAHASGRNDILIGEKKVAGNAFYHLPGRSIAHGTMLYNFDPACLAGALTPSKAKLESKGVKSVPMRVTCLRQEGITLPAAEFERYMIESITDGEPYRLTGDDIREVEEIEKGYYDPAFLRVRQEDAATGSGQHRTESRRHIPGLGEFCVSYTLDSREGRIRNLAISGDFFMSGDVESQICARLEGHKADRVLLADTIASLPLAQTIPGLDGTTLLELIIPADGDARD